MRSWAWPTKAALITGGLLFAACGIRSEASFDDTEPTLRITAVIANRTATDLEMTFTSEGEGRSSAGGGSVPACTVSTISMPAYSGGRWDLVIADPEGLGSVELIRLSTENRPDLVVPPNRARRLQVEINDEEAALKGNVLIDEAMADDDQGIEEIPECP